MSTDHQLISNNKAFKTPKSIFDTNPIAREVKNRINKGLENSVTHSIEEELCPIPSSNSNSLKQRTNHKRAIIDVDNDKHAPLRHQPSQFRLNHQSQSLRRFRQFPELSEKRACQPERSTSLPPRSGPIAATENDTLEEMHGKSPGKRKRNSRHSTDLTLDEDESSSAEDPVISSDLYENGDVISAKRVKPNTSSKLKDAGEYTDSHERKVTPKPKIPWAAYERYRSNAPEANSLPQYGHFPEKYPSVETKPPEGKKMKPLCPPGPVNTLRRDEPRTPVGRLSMKPFDLTSEHSRQNGSHPNKRQKVERPTKHRDSVVIDSDEEAPNASIRKRHSEERDVSPDARESQKPQTEKTVQGGQRPSNSSSECRMMSGGRFSNQANNSRRIHKSIWLEDLTDEISDLEPEPETRRGPGPGLSKNVSVQISVSPNVSHGMRQRGAASKLDHRTLEDDSLDELAIAPLKDETIAKGFLTGARQSNEGLNASKGKVVLSKYGKLQARADIVPAMGKSQERYPIAQLFSEKYIWLRQGHRIIWHLVQDIKTGAMTFRNEHGNIVDDISLTPAGIRKLLWNNNSPKLILEKPINNTCRNASNIYVELYTVDNCETVAVKLKKNHLDMRLECLDVSTLDKRFKHRLKEIDAALKRSSPKDKPADIKLAERNSERRTEEENKKRKHARQASVGHKINESSKDINNPQPRESLAKRMRTLLSPSDDETTKNKDPPFRNPTIKNTDFYNSSRPSTRNTGRDPAPRTTPRPGSSSPEKWTKKNPGWAKNWHGSIVYPPKAKNRAIVDKADIERLDEGEFLNDNLIDFYLLYLKERLERENPEVARRIYFNNTFFYTALTKATKGKRGINYEGVQRWTKEVDLLQYDYIIVPVNESQHWYVAIICNAPKLLPTEQNTAEPSSSQDGDGSRVHEVDIDTAPAKTSPSSKSSLQLDPISEQDVNSKVEELSLEDTPNTGEETLIGPLQLKQQTTERTDVEIISDDQTDTSAAKNTTATTSGPEGSNPEGDKGLQPKKRGRKPIPSAVRKVDPFQPRIITLDSLNLRHSPTCTNLKEYLVAEIKSKRGIDIVPPTSIGMKANNLPQQQNFCDCGVFVLTYVERFLKGPDEFIRGVMLNSQDVEDEWENPTELRARIRKMLFNLQEVKLSDEAKVSQVNGGLKQASKTNNKSISHIKFDSGEPSAPPLTKLESPDADGDGQGDGMKSTIEQDAEPQDIESRNIHSMDGSQETEEVQNVSGGFFSRHLHPPKSNKTSNQLDSTRYSTMNSNIIDMKESPTKQYDREEVRYFNRRPPQKSPRSKTPEDESRYSKVRERQPTPFPVRTPGTAERLNDSELTEISDSDLEDSVQLVEARSKARNLDDEEMLFGIGSPKTSEGFPDIPLLRSPSSSPQNRKNTTDDGRHCAENDETMDGKDGLETALLMARKRLVNHF